MRQGLIEGGRAQVDREHSPPHELALHARGTAIGNAQGLARHAARAVGAHQVARAHRHGGAAIAGRRHARMDAFVVLIEVHQFPAEGHGPAGAGLRVFAQHRLHELLRHAVRQLGRVPGAAQAAHVLAGLRGRGQAQPRELVRGEAREVGDVGGVVARQAQGADLVGDADAAEVLHGARLRGVGLRVEGGGGLRVHQQAAYAAQAQFVGEHQPARARARDEHVYLDPCATALRVLQLLHRFSSVRCWPMCDWTARIAPMRRDGRPEKDFSAGQACMVWSRIRGEEPCNSSSRSA